MLILFILRFFVFHLYESPKYLIAHGRDAEAVAVVHAIAQYNGRTSSLTLAMLEEVDVPGLPSSTSQTPFQSVWKGKL